MPSEPLLDLSAIDLNHPVEAREGIARYNPHRGQMALLDAVVWHSDDLLKGVGLWRVRSEEFWVPGHIPGDPLMPGVLMVEAGAQLASYMYYKKAQVDWFAGFARIEDCSFRGRVVPGDDFYLLCDVTKFGLKRFNANVQGIARGQIAFDASITGLAFPKMGTVART